MRTMKDFYSREKITALKGMARVLIKYEISTRDFYDSLTEEDTNRIGYECCRRFDCMNCDFRFIFDEWVFHEAEMEYKKRA